METAAQMFKQAPKPNAKLHNPAPFYLRELIAASGYNQAQAAELIGISLRAMHNYLSLTADKHRDAPYTVQYALEQLADK